MLCGPEGVRTAGAEEAASQDRHRGCVHASTEGEGWLTVCETPRLEHVVHIYFRVHYPMLYAVMHWLIRAWFEQQCSISECKVKVSSLNIMILAHDFFRAVVPCVRM